MKCIPCSSHIYITLSCCTPLHPPICRIYLSVAQSVWQRLPGLKALTPSRLITHHPSLKSPQPTTVTFRPHIFPPPSQTHQHRKCLMSPGIMDKVRRSGNIALEKKTVMCPTSPAHCIAGHLRLRRLRQSIRNAHLLQSKERKSNFHQ